MDLLTFLVFYRPMKNDCTDVLYLCSSNWFIMYVQFIKMEIDKRALIPRHLLSGNPMRQHSERIFTCCDNMSKTDIDKSGKAVRI